ncbi:hypothetical protein A3G65_01000 [Candidatus Roizmanbacteria bacterium RIFCSPLOWO2_12_FULL_37_7b]|nr:MAG: hypothetical protein A3G65_01000 [Candidatus Roizmanbacteria bacterium RIFCSPLOWO2_12_FULL_37_7b]
MPKDQNKQPDIIRIITRIGVDILFFAVSFLIFVGDALIFTLKFIVHLFIYSLKGTFYGFNSVSLKIKSAIKALNIPHLENIEVKHKLKEKTIFTFSRFSNKTKLKYFLLGLLFAISVVFIERSYTFIKSLPNPKLIGNINYPVSTQIYDRNGKLLYEIFRDQDRTPIDIDDLPDHVIQATIAIEDKNFLNHNGISPIGGILRALKDMAKTGELQGGSTITQQLVKSALLTPERTIERKLREAILALWTERLYTKKEILEMYLNQVPYGGSAYGIEEAAKTYFNKSAVSLTISEAAFLAGTTRAPTKYSPFFNPRLALQRKNEVLKNMYELGYIKKDQYEEEITHKLDVQSPKTFIRAPHFVFYVTSLLEKQYGIRKVEEGGLRVITSLDVGAQERAEDILSEELLKIENLNVHNGAVLVTVPSTGEILTMVGSRNYFEEPYGAYNVTTAPRQPGSSIKPLMYSLALGRQYTAASIIQDSPVVFQIPGGKPYRPVNYDNTFHGPVPLRYALANSYNVPAVKVLNTLGVHDFIDHAEKLGITTWNSPERFGLSLTLGGGEVKMIDMAEAYGTFANYGNRVPLNPILSIKDFRGEELYEFEKKSYENVLSPEISFIISDILSDNFARQFAFGTNSDLVIPNRKVAVKTGTTNSKRDNWTIGYNRKFLTAVWVGNNDNSPMHPTLTSGITGASPIWNKIMTYVLDTDIKVHEEVQPPSEFSIPSGMVTKTCYFNKPEFFITGTEGTNGCGDSIFNTSPSPQVSPRYFPQ